jgi:hypothetical protein
MNEQDQVKRALKQQASIEFIRELLASGGHESRAAVAESTCQHFRFLDARGRSQIAGCAKALRELERVGQLCSAAAHAPAP